MKVYLVQAERSGEPECYTFGVFGNIVEANDLVDRLADEDGEWGFEYAWCEEMELGVDLSASGMPLCNR